MNYIVFTLTLLLCSSSLGLAQTAGGSTGGSPAASGTASAGSGGAAGGTLSNGQTINGTGGSPGPNTSNALSHGTTGSNMGAVSATQGAPSHGNAVDTPAANSAANSLGNTNTGILKK